MGASEKIYSIIFFGNSHSLSALLKQHPHLELANATATIVSAMFELVYHYPVVSSGGLLAVLISSGHHHGGGVMLMMLFFGFERLI